MDVIPRPYQARDFDRIRRAFASGKKAPVYVAPTGSGKGFVIAYVAKHAKEKGLRVYALGHREEICNQISGSLAEMGVQHGRIGRGQRVTRDMIQVCSVATLARRLDRLPAPDFLLIDEAHHAPAGLWQKIIKAYPDAKVLGFTATLLRLDRRGFTDIFDSLIVGPSVAELIELGFLCPAEVYAPSNVGLSGIHRKGGDFDSKELSERMDTRNITGDAVEHYRRICDGQPAIAFCVSVLHANHVADQFRQAGYSALCVDGGTDASARRDAIRSLGEGKLNVLTSCEIVSEGTDIPRVSVIISLRPTQSLAMHLQQVGRGARIYEGKTKFIHLDHAGNTLRHGMYDEDREWTLEGKTRKRDEAPAISVRQCPECYRVYRAFLHACPGCGHKIKLKPREVAQVEGELVKLDKERAEYLAKKRAQDEVRSCKTLEDLQELGRRRGYKPGWARRRFEIIESYKMKQRTATA